MSALRNRVAIVTGASSGIGHAAARLFAAEGAAVVVAARRQAHLDELVDHIAAAGGRALARAGDVADEAFARSLVDAATDTFGGLDIAFNNAGTVGEMGPATELSLTQWNHVLATNLTSAFLGARHQLPALVERGGGSLIFSSSIAGYSVGLPGMAAYATSKVGLIGLTRVLASEYGALGIRVNALLPGHTDTPMGRVAATTPESEAFVRNLHALKRIATPEEIARSALYLASDASSFTTGTALVVDGGASGNRT